MVASLPIVFAAPLSGTCTIWETHFVRNLGHPLSAATPLTPTESRQARPARLTAARRRAQLRRVALELFGSHGYHDTSMDDIAEAAGVTKPVLYQHFPSKQELYLELLRSVGTDLREAVTHATRAADPADRVLAGFRTYFNFVAERPDAFTLIFGRGAREMEAAINTIQSVEDDLATLIGDAIDAEITPEHRKVLGYSLVGLAEVTGRQWARRLHNGEGADGLDVKEADRVATWAADLVWAGLRSLPARGGEGG